MPTFFVDIEAATHPSVQVDFDHEPTPAEINESLELLAQEMTFVGYMAEFIVTEGGDYTTTITRFE